MEASEREKSNLLRGLNRVRALLARSRDAFLKERRPGGFFTGNFFEKVKAGNKKTLLMKTHYGVSTFYHPDKQVIVQVISKPGELPKGVERVEKIQGVKYYRIVADEKLHDYIREAFPEGEYKLKLETPVEYAKRPSKFSKPSRA